LKARKEHPVVLFNKIDTNHSGYLDFNEFFQFLNGIAPCYTRAEVLKIFRHIDSDHNGLVSKPEFTGLLANKFPSGKEHHISSLRGKRNLQQFAEYVKWSKITPEKILELAGKDKNATIDMKEFEELVTKKLNFQISIPEINEVFKEIDGSSDGSINLAELTAVIK